MYKKTIKRGENKYTFDYYIYIDYSENLIGYVIIHRDKIKEILPLISRFRHYRDAKNRKLYLKNVSTTIKKYKIKNYFYKVKIKEFKLTLEIYSNIAEFINEYKDYNIFISVDNKQYNNFKKLVKVIDGEKIIIKKESELKEGTIEYKLSLIIDNLLNIERRKTKK